MSEEILINVTPPETRVALIENGVLQELIIERSRMRGLVGNIYKGEVCRVLPGMQAAFVDIGLERAAFLHLSDLCAKDLEKKGSENIEAYLHESQQIVVQVVKDPSGYQRGQDHHGAFDSVAVSSLHALFQQFRRFPADRMR